MYLQSRRTRMSIATVFIEWKLRTVQSSKCAHFSWDEIGKWQALDQPGVWRMWRHLNQKKKKREERKKEIMNEKEIKEKQKKKLHCSRATDGHIHTHTYNDTGTRRLENHSSGGTCVREAWLTNHFLVLKVRSYLWFSTVCPASPAPPSPRKGSAQYSHLQWRNAYSALYFKLSKNLALSRDCCIDVNKSLNDQLPMGAFPYRTTLESETEFSCVNQYISVLWRV